MSKFKKMVSITLCLAIIFLLSNVKVYAATYRLIPDRIPNINCRIYMSFNYDYSVGEYSLNHDYETLCHFAAQSWNYNLSLYDIPGYCSIVSSNSNSQVYVMSADYFSAGEYGFTSPNSDNTQWTICVNAGICESETDKVVQFVFAHEIGHHYGLGDLGFFDTRSSVMSEYTDKETYYNPQYNDMMGVKASYNLN